jgi:elongation factor G
MRPTAWRETDARRAEQALRRADRALLEGDQIPGRDLIDRSVRAQTIARTIVPVLVGASLRNIGVQPLLDAVVDYLPAPDELPPITGHTRRRTRRSPSSAPYRRPGPRAGVQDPDRARSREPELRPGVQREDQGRVAVMNHNQRKRERVNRLLKRPRQPNRAGRYARGRRHRRDHRLQARADRRHDRVRGVSRWCSNGCTSPNR